MIPLRHPEDVLENLFTNISRLGWDDLDQWVAYAKNTYSCCFHWSET